MTKENIIEMAYKVDTDDAYTSFISTFADDYNMLIVAIISSWVQNGERDMFYTIQKIVNEKMESNPSLFVLSHKRECGYNESFCENISDNNFVNLINTIKKVTLFQGGVRNAYEQYMSSSRHRCKYSHEAMSIIFGYGTHFPSISCKGTFFRYNLLLYWLSYKFGLWSDMDTKRVLLPCNDKIFANAKRFGVTDVKYKSTLSSTIKLTNIARDWFGDADFWKMYEFLNFYDYEYDKK